MKAHDMAPVAWEAIVASALGDELVVTVLNGVMWLKKTRERLEMGVSGSVGRRTAQRNPSL